MRIGNPVDEKGHRYRCGWSSWLARKRSLARRKTARHSLPALPLPYEIVRLNHAGFSDPDFLAASVENSDLVLHFAGVNRGIEAEVEAANPQIAGQLADAIKRSGTKPHIVYANSIHAAADTPYGRSKRNAADRLAATDLGFTNLFLPHIFGECARPYYNNVTATLIDQIIKDENSRINPDSVVRLLHAGNAAQTAINAGVGGRAG